MMQFALFFFFGSLVLVKDNGLCLFLSWTTFLLTYFTRTNSLKHTHTHTHTNNNKKKTLMLRRASFLFLSWTTFLLTYFTRTNS